jgi:hypothetical protein
VESLLPRFSGRCSASISLLAWLRETFAPGSTARIETGAPDPAQWSPPLIILRGIFAAILLAFAGIGIALAARTVVETVVFTVAGIVYFVIAYDARPRPDLDDIGLAGGLIDHPLRWSDDVNRALVIFGVILWPGRFRTVSLRDLFWYLRGRRVMVLPPRE